MGEPINLIICDNYHNLIVHSCLKGRRKGGGDANDNLEVIFCCHSSNEGLRKINKAMGKTCFPSRRDTLPQKKPSKQVTF